MSTAEYQRRWRASKGARTGARGRPVSRSHGTYAAYKRHLYHGESPCDACRAANSTYHRERYAARRNRKEQRP